MNRLKSEIADVKKKTFSIPLYKIVQVLSVLVYDVTVLLKEI